MKVLTLFALVWTCTLCHAAIFDFNTERTAATPSRGSAQWAIDTSTARQWYLAWAGSAERVYRQVISPVTGNVRGSQPLVATETLAARSVLFAMWIFVAAALASIIKGIGKISLMWRKPLRATAS